MTPSTLRTLAEYRIGSDLAERIAHAEDVIRQQREGLAWAVTEIERLTAEIERQRQAATLQA